MRRLDEIKYITFIITRIAPKIGQNLLKTLRHILKENLKFDILNTFKRNF